MKQEIIYVAGPYSHPSPDVRSGREILLTEAAWLCAKAGHCVYSPITASAPLERLGLDWRLDQWLKFDWPFMELATRLLVVKLSGWEESRGVTHEINNFLTAGKHVTLLHLSEVEEWAAGLNK